MKYRNFILKDFDYTIIGKFFVKLFGCCCKNERWFPLKRTPENKNLRQEPTHLLKVVEAPEPEGIQWENREKSKLNRMLRFFCSQIATLILMLVIYYFL